MGGAGGTARALLRCLGVLCLVVGLWPRVYARSHPHDRGTMLGLPCSPIFRSYRKTVESPRSHTIDEEGRRVESSWSSSTVYGWEIRVLGWSAGLVALGGVLLFVSLRRGARRGAAP